MIAHRRSRPPVYCRSPIRTHLRSAMAQRISEPLPFAALEEIPLLAPPPLTLTSTVPPSAHAFHFQMHGDPLAMLGHWQAFAGPKSVKVTAIGAPDALLIAFPSQGFVTFDTHLAVVASVVGSLPSRQSVSLPPLASGPLSVLPFGLPTDRTPAMQAQHLMALAQKL